MPEPYISVSDSHLSGLDSLSGTRRRDSSPRLGDSHIGRRSESPRAYRIGDLKQVAERVFPTATCISPRGRPTSSAPSELIDDSGFRARFRRRSVLKLGRLARWEVSDPGIEGVHRYPRGGFEPRAAGGSKGGEFQTPLISYPHIPFLGIGDRAARNVRLRWSAVRI